MGKLVGVWYLGSNQIVKEIEINKSNIILRFFFCMVSDDVCKEKKYIFEQTEEFLY